MKSYILVIDDDLLSRCLVRAVLETEGHTIRQAMDGMEGVRAQRKRPADLVLCDVIMSDMAGPEAGGRDIERALATLVEDQRTALLLVVLEGLTYREVAEVQGVPIGTVMSRLARARTQIKSYLDGSRPSLRRIK